MPVRAGGAGATRTTRHVAASSLGHFEASHASACASKVSTLTRRCSPRSRAASAAVSAASASLRVPRTVVLMRRPETRHIGPGGRAVREGSRCDGAASCHRVTLGAAYARAQESTRRSRSAGRNRTGPSGPPSRTATRQPAVLRSGVNPSARDAEEHLHVCRLQQRVHVLEPRSLRSSNRLRIGSGSMSRHQRLRCACRGAARVGAGDWVGDRRSVSALVARHAGRECARARRRRRGGSSGGACSAGCSRGASVRRRSSVGVRLRESAV